MAGGLERPPLWANVTMVVSVLLLAVGVVYARNRSVGEPLSQTQVARMDAAASSAAKSDAINAPIRLLIVGDSYTGGSDMGGNGTKNWTKIVSGQLTDAGYHLELAVAAGSGSGYTQGGLRNMTFDQLLINGGGGFDLVVVFGSRNDVVRGTVGPAAGQVLADARAKSPGARLLVIGPPWVNGRPPAVIVGDRDAVRAAAAAAGAAFVDPLAERWFAGADAALIGTDGVHPTDAGHAYLAAKIGPYIRSELDAVKAARATR